jgi:LuxR family maltose regulon positive regulatory protein
VVDQEDFQRLPGLLAVFRAGYAISRGDAAGTLQYAKQALLFFAEDDHIWRGAAAALLGLAYWPAGNLEEAYRSFAEGMAQLQKAGYISDAVGGRLALADIRITQGRLGEAMRIYEQGLQLAVVHGQPHLRGTADMYVGIGAIQLERNDLAGATQQLLHSQEQGEHTGFPQHPYRWRVAMARIRAVEGDLQAALELLGEAEQRYVGDFYPNVRPIAALKARVWIAQGKLAEALDWAHRQGLSAQDELTYLREFEHITLARLLLAHYQRERAEQTLLDAVALLQRLLDAAQAGGRIDRVIEILVLQALAYQHQDDMTAALVPLQRALALAEPEGYVRIFVDEGAAMAQLLREAARRRMMPSYISRLLAAFDGTQPQNTAPSPHPTRPAAHALIEPLSERELEVLRLLSTDLSGPEIARKLIVSLNTLNTHTKNIYSKLGANNRRAAVRRAEELKLL